jgi:hypothetical protein
VRTQTVLIGALAVLALAANARAQAANGTVNFCNNRSSLLYFLQDTNPVSAGSGIKAALYWAPVGSSNFVKLGASATVGVPLDGIFAGGTRVAGAGTPGGAVGQFQVRSWGGPSTSYEQAFTNGGYRTGISAITTMPTGNPTNVPPTPPTSLAAAGFQGFGLGQSPIIVVPPANLTVGIGRTAVLPVTAIGATPLSYQWQLNGTNLADSAHIAGSLTPALTILNVQTNDAGTYRVIVTNLYGVTTSPGAVLSVVRLCMPPPAGLIGWWKGDGNGNDSAGGNNAYSIEYTTFANGVVGQAFANDPENQPYGVYTGVRIADAPAYVLTNSLTLEGWIRVRGGAYCVFCRGDNRPGYDPYVMSTGANNVMNLLIADANANSVTLSTPLVYSQWYHVAGTLDGASGKMSLYTNGTIAAQITTTIRPLGNLIPGDYPGIGIGNVNDNFNNFPFWGDIDEISLYNRALTPGEIQGIYNAYSAGKCLACPPVITVPPTNQIVVPGSTAVFSVLAGGSPVLGYQWWFNGTNALSATTSTLTLPNAQLTNAGSYQVIITNAFGSATSPVAMLTVAFPPQILVQPTNLAVLAGSNAAFSVTATGTAPLSYQWSLNGTNLADSAHIIGSSTPALTILNAQRSDAGTYRVTVTNLYGVAVSSNAVLTVVPVCVPPPAGLIGWWKGEGNGLDSAGANNAYTMTDISSTNGMVGQAFKANPADSTVVIPDSPSLRLTNQLTIEVWIYPQSTNGDRAIVSKVGGVAGNYGYQFYLRGNMLMGQFNSAGLAWPAFVVSSPGIIPTGRWSHVAWTYDQSAMKLYVNGQPVATNVIGAKPIATSSSTLRISGDDNNHVYFDGLVDEVSLYNRALSGEEIAAIYNAFGAGKCLTVPPVITIPPTNQAVLLGGTAVFTVLAGGSPALGYQWRFNGTNTLAATTPALSIANAQLTNGGDYQVIITNAYGSATSPVATLTVAMPPVITAQPTNRAVLVGSNAAFTVTATGTPPLAYQWWFNGTNALTAPSATFNIPNAQLADAGSYNVVVTNNYGQATSVIAYLSVASPPRFQSVSARNGTLTMTWNGATGFTYLVQYKTNLLQLYWSNLGSPIFATGNTVTAYDVISTDRQRFYRAALLP